MGSNEVAVIHFLDNSAVLTRKAFRCQSTNP